MTSPSSSDSKKSSKANVQKLYHIEDQKLFWSTVDGVFNLLALSFSFSAMLFSLTLIIDFFSPNSGVKIPARLGYICAALPTFAIVASITTLIFVCIPKMRILQAVQYFNISQIFISAYLYLELKTYFEQSTALQTAFSYSHPVLWCFFTVHLANSLLCVFAIHETRKMTTPPSLDSEKSAKANILKSYRLVDQKLFWSTVDDVFSKISFIFFALTACQYLAFFVDLIINTGFIVQNYNALIVFGVCVLGHDCLQLGISALCFLNAEKIPRKYWPLWQCVSVALFFLSVYIFFQIKTYYEFVEMPVVFKYYYWLFLPGFSIHFANLLFCIFAIHETRKIKIPKKPYNGPGPYKIIYDGENSSKQEMRVEHVFSFD